MMMIAFITFKSSLVPLFEGLWSSNSSEFEFSGFWRNRTDDLGIDSPSLWPTEPRLHVRSRMIFFLCFFHFSDSRQTDGFYNSDHSYFFRRSSGITGLLPQTRHRHYDQMANADSRIILWRHSPNPPNELNLISSNLVAGVGPTVYP